MSSDHEDLYVGDSDIGSPEVPIQDSFPGPSSPKKIKLALRTTNPEKKKNLNKINSKKWKQLMKKADNWIRFTDPNPPSFALLYWEVSKGRHQVVWKVPEHMKSFARDKDVQEKFQSIAMSFNYAEDWKGEKPKSEPESKTILLPSRNAEDYVADLLYKILPRIMNPEGKYNFYSNQLNKSKWFPGDLPFKSPNHPKKNNSKYTAKEMRCILQAFIDQCPDQYELKDDSSKEDDSNSDDGSEDDGCKDDDSKDEDADNGCSADDGNEDDGSKDDDSKDDRSKSKNVSKDDDQPESLLRVHAAVDGSANSLKPRRVLGLLKDCAHAWPLLKRAVEAIKKAVDLQVLESINGVKTASQIPHFLLDKKRQKQLGNKIPRKYMVGKSCGNGDCLFNSVSLLLFGTQRYSDLLRLATVCNGVDHFDHYCEMYASQLSDLSEAQAFVSAVASSDKVFDNKPSDATVQEMLHYILEKEICTTTICGSYSGMLQIQFLAGAVGVAIRQHTEEEDEASFSQLTLFPCCFSEVRLTTIHIMWVRMSNGSRDMNHIVPLLPEEREDPVATSVMQNYRTDIASSIREVCIFKGARQCMVNHLHGESDVHWIQCSRCSSWYHCACVGVTEQSFPSFACCKQISSSEDKIIAKGGSLKDRTSFQLSFYDVRSLYPGNGTSDRVIDFFIRRVLPTVASCKPGTMILSVCVYESIKQVLSLKRGNLHDAFKSTIKATVGISPQEMWNRDVILFPCKPRIGQGSESADIWHWIVIAVVPTSKTAYVLDSAGGSTKIFAKQTVEDLQIFFSTLVGTDVCLNQEFIKVAEQNDGYNCGIHVMHNIQILAQHSSDDFIRAFKSARKIPDTAHIRGLCLLTCYQLVKEKSEVS